MKKSYYILLAALGMLAGCAQELETPSVDDEIAAKEKFQLTVTISEETKTYMASDKDGDNKRKVYWSNDDAICVSGVESDALAGLAADTQTVTFDFSGGTPSTPYKIVYPASIWDSDGYVELPAIQTYKDGGFADGMFPMAAYSATGGNISGMSHLCSIIKLTVTRATGADPDTDDIRSVRFRGHNDEQVKGRFAIDYENAALTGASSAEEDKIVRVVSTQSTETGANYWIVVPAGTYSNGFEFIITDVNGDMMTKGKSSSVTLEKGHLYPMAEFAFAPDGTDLADVEIGTPEELIAFATDYNDKVYESYGAGLVVKLTADLAFNSTTSASFNNTKGIGKRNGVDGATEDFMFNGLFDGDNHTITGLSATVPLFVATRAATVIKDLNIDSSCSLTVNSPAVDKDHGILVDYNKGLVDHCSSAASLIINNIQDIYADDTENPQYYGGLVGYNQDGRIQGCSVSGNIECSQSEEITTPASTESSVYVGGITGYQNKAEAYISSSNFTGNITFSDGTDYGGIVAAKRNVYIGGIIGVLSRGSVSNCTTATSEISRSIDVRGTMVPWLAGIAGYATDGTISGCTNYMSVSFKSGGTRANTTPCRVAGIAGRSLTSVSDCYNYGAISSVSQSTTLWMGGICGDAGGEIINCNNETGGTLTRTNQTDGTQSNRYIAMGGISGGAAAALNIESCTNRNQVLSNTPSSTKEVTIDLGGILGYSNTFAVTIDDCKNYGTIKSLDETNKQIFARTTVGGILGYSKVAGSSVKNSNNYGLVHCAYTKGGTSYRDSYIGGIVGLMGNHTAYSSGVGSISGLANLEIYNCINEAQVWSQNYNNSITVAEAPFGGGIVGAIAGTEESKASVSECQSNSSTALTNYRGFVGGIAAYAANAELSSSSVSYTLSGNNNATGIGGICAWAVATTLDDCTFFGTISTVKNIGGLIYTMDGSSTIKDCKVSGATINKGTNDAATDPAVLVNTASSGASISNCGVKGTLAGEAITLESRMITTDEGAVFDALKPTYLIP